MTWMVVSTRWWLLILLKIKNLYEGILIDEGGSLPEEELPKLQYRGRFLALRSQVKYSDEDFGEAARIVEILDPNQDKQYRCIIFGETPEYESSWCTKLLDKLSGSGVQATLLSVEDARCSRSEWEILQKKAVDAGIRLFMPEHLSDFAPQFWLEVIKFVLEELPAMDDKLNALLVKLLREKLNSEELIDDMVEYFNDNHWDIFVAIGVADVINGPLFWEYTSKFLEHLEKLKSESDIIENLVKEIMLAESKVPELFWKFMKIISKKETILVSEKDILRIPYEDLLEKMKMAWDEYGELNPSDETDAREMAKYIMWRLFEGILSAESQLHPTILKMISTILECIKNIGPQYLDYATRNHGNHSDLLTYKEKDKDKSNDTLVQRKIGNDILPIEDTIRTEPSSGSEWSDNEGDSDVSEIEFDVDLPAYFNDKHFDKKKILTYKEKDKDQSNDTLEQRKIGNDILPIEDTIITEPDSGSEWSDYEDDSDVSEIEFEVDFTPTLTDKREADLLKAIMEDYRNDYGNTDKCDYRGEAIKLLRTHCGRDGAFRPKKLFRHLISIFEEKFGVRLMDLIRKFINKVYGRCNEENQEFKRKMMAALSADDSDSDIDDSGTNEEETLSNSSASDSYENENSATTEEDDVVSASQMTVAQLPLETEGSVTNGQNKSSVSDNSNSNEEGEASSFSSAPQEIIAQKDSCQMIGSLLTGGSQGSPSQVDVGSVTPMTDAPLPLVTQDASAQWGLCCGAIGLLLIYFGFSLFTRCNRLPCASERSIRK